MEHPYHYRNKVHAVFDIAKGGTVISGVYKAGTHDVVNIDSCRIEDETADAIIRDIRGLLRSFKIQICRINKIGIQQDKFFLQEHL